MSIGARCGLTVLAAERRRSRVAQAHRYRRETRRDRSDPLLVATSASAVRVGEPFSLVLTCAVVETDAVTVVPDQADSSPPRCSCRRST